MLGVLCARPKPWILSSLTNFLHISTVHHHHNRQQPPLIQSSEINLRPRRRNHSNACKLRLSPGGAASIWHAILPSGDLRRPAFHHEPRNGDGSWNVALDARPARWLHGRDSAWLLFGVCACVDYWVVDVNVNVNVCGESEKSSCGGVDVERGKKSEGFDSKVECDEKNKNGGDNNNAVVIEKDDHERSADYRVKGVVADGRCLFRAIAHSACLRNGEEAPDEIRQRELADELRAQVVDELLKRREETEWFIEGDFDKYVERIQQPYVWGGEPELLMASHVLKSQISVFMRDKSSGDLVNIAKYGEEYHKDNEGPINVLFHGYGHYDILETSAEKSCQNLDA